MTDVTAYASVEHMIMGNGKVEMKKDKQKKHEEERYETKPCTVFV